MRAACLQDFKNDERKEVQTGPPRDVSLHRAGSDVNNNIGSRDRVDGGFRFRLMRACGDGHIVSGIADVEAPKVMFCVIREQTEGLDATRGAEGSKTGAYRQKAQVLCMLEGVGPESLTCWLTLCIHPGVAFPERQTLYHTEREAWVCCLDSFEYRYNCGG